MSRRTQRARRAATLSPRRRTPSCSKAWREAIWARSVSSSTDITRERPRVAERGSATPPTAADLVQETFLTASRAAASFERGAAAKPFLLGVAAQLARRRRRSFARLRAMLEAFAHVPVAPRATPEDDPLEGRMRRCSMPP